MNGIPLKMSGITNDAYNLILMHRDLNTGSIWHYS